MHEIEPYWKWRNGYVAQEDKRSPFYGVEGNPLQYTQKVYNYYIHPQWDDFGSSTLYIKVLFVDYQEGFAIIEMIGEWNDCIDNDIMFLKREVIDLMIPEGIYKYVLIGENVLNFHASDDCYYEEWAQEIEEEGGWIVPLNFNEHVIEEMESIDLHYYLYLNQRFSQLDWRKLTPHQLVHALEEFLLKRLE